jgi:hypothetical protein
MVITASVFGEVPVPSINVAPCNTNVSFPLCSLNNDKDLLLGAVDSVAQRFIVYDNENMNNESKATQSMFICT